MIRVITNTTRDEFHGLAIEHLEMIVGGTDSPVVNLAKLCCAVAQAAVQGATVAHIAAGA